MAKRIWVPGAGKVDNPDRNKYCFDLIRTVFPEIKFYKENIIENNKTNSVIKGLCIALEYHDGTISLDSFASIAYLSLLFLDKVIFS